MADLETLERIRLLQDHVGFKALRDLAEEQRTAYLINLARQIGHSSEPVDQRVLDYKRGFFNGMMWVLQVPITERFKAELEKALDERTTSE